MSTTQRRPQALNKKELKKFQELLEEKRKACSSAPAECSPSRTWRSTPTICRTRWISRRASTSSRSSSAFAAARRALLSKLDLALKKIEDGTFGVCEICEEPIGKKRLEARPETTLCIKCKEDQEREERTMG